MIISWEHSVPETTVQEVPIADLPCLLVQCEGRSTLLDISPHGTLVRIPSHHGLVPEKCQPPPAGAPTMLTDLSQAVKAASAARYFAELQATPTARGVILGSLPLES